jgi:signal transduction histidine kinase
VNRQATADLDLDAEQWFSASATELELLHSVERDLLDEVVTESASLTSAARRSTAITIAMIALTLLIAVAASFGVAESMARTLRFLRHRAQQIADERLPEAVRRLRTTVSGELDVGVEPVGIDTKDEIGDLAQAFDDVHRQAIRLAAEQAALRSNVSAMFLNLARRSQGLVDRLLARISELEHEQTDPAELENLYLLDHLATRVRRNAENLVVLSGADPSVRRWGEPVPLSDVVEAAIAEVEDYARVDLGVVDEVSVLGWAASDLTHLLAELIENATTFSPPSVPVVVTGAAVGNGYVLEVEDRGLGMTDDELLDINQRLADPPLLDFSVRQRLGLYVVARLAQRYDVKVQLRHSAYGGVVALVRLPVSTLAGSAVLGPLQAASMAASLQASAGGADGRRPAGLTTLTSDWFTADVREVYMPLRPHGIRRVGALPRLNGAAGPLSMEATAGEPSGQGGGFQPPPAAVAPPEGPAGRQAGCRPGSVSRGSSRGSRGYRPASPAGAPATPVAVGEGQGDGRWLPSHPALTPARAGPASTADPTRSPRAVPGRRPTTWPSRHWSPPPTSG